MTSRNTAPDSAPAVHHRGPITPEFTLCGRAPTSRDVSHRDFIVNTPEDARCLSCSILCAELPEARDLCLDCAKVAAQGYQRIADYRRIHARHLELAPAVRS